jgi:hypothetical protein
MKVKQIYFEQDGVGDFTTGLVLELEDGRFMKQQSTDMVKPFEEITNIKIIKSLDA